MKKFIIGIVFLILYCVLCAYIDFFIDLNLKQLYYEFGFWEFFKESIIKTLKATAISHAIFGHF